MTLELSPDRNIFEDSLKKKRGRPPSVKPTACALCNTPNTPEWRKGPNNASVCNACGLQYAKQTKREKECKVKCAITNILSESPYDPVQSVMQYFIDCNGSPLVFAYIPEPNRH